MGITNETLAILVNNKVQVSDEDTFPETGQAEITLTFSSGAIIRACYWRVVKDGRQLLSSFDHQQQYGLSSPIDAKKEAQKELENRNVARVEIDNETGDLILWFSGNLKLQILNFTHYEIWEVSFPDGSGGYSNYNK